jgi:hypothetical protein
MQTARQSPEPEPDHIMIILTYANVCESFAKAKWYTPRLPRTGFNEICGHLLICRILGEWSSTDIPGKSAKDSIAKQSFV